MRTTVTLDPDVESLIKRTMHERGLSFKDALNSGLRSGLGAAKAAKKRFEQKTYPMGSQEHFRWEKALAAADAIEDEELVRKLSLRK